MNTNDLLLVLGMTLVTVAARYPVLALVSKVTLPPALLAALKFIPPAVLTALILPALLAPDGRVDASLGNSYWVAGLITTFVAWRSKNLLLTLGVGMMLFWGWRALWSFILAL
jgi:branched-subunit amino acid transport protein